MFEKVLAAPADPRHTEELKKESRAQKSTLVLASTKMKMVKRLYLKQ
ncbi:hypothetical protein K08M4_17160 [Vibrio syngnathi]|uniref:Uncharacterized protein n=1 Tax=Vibrio syngnathi TaxID=3034029 RepID=A0AA34TP26_9VIBR|nr:hypothetical protein K08M4_17160 [Vibrio syngnathi]